jgi:amino acid adenylation domain-containing protein
LPLSYAQQRLWFLDQIEPNSSLYNIPRAVRLTGPLNVEALQQSLDTILARHEALRTMFASIDGSPVQIVAEPRSVDLPIVDLGELQAADREAEVRRLCTKEAQRPFDLSSDLMIRVALLRLDNKEHVLIIVMHHVASDGWSMDVLFRELSILYEAFSFGKPSPLPELPIQYADFAVWQRNWLKGEVLAKQLRYWRQHLRDAPPVLGLPTDRPRPQVQTYKGARQSFMLPKSLTTSLKALGAREEVTLFMTLLAAFQTLLYRYSGQEDIIVGTPIANRNRDEIENLIGFFVNTLVMRTDLSGEPSFRKLLKRVRETALEAYTHQDLPFEMLVEKLQSKRELSQSPLFQVMFALQNVPRKDVELSGLSINPMQVGTETAKFDLSLFMWEVSDEIKGSLEYSTDLFDNVTINRMIGHFKTLLKNIAADMNQTISRLPILTQTERRQLLDGRNNTRVDYPKDKCIHGLFEDQVERTPDAIAVVYEKRQLTYHELNTRANQLARFLKKLGVGPEVLVGICMERSIEMIVGILGILKAGGAYVPMDPSYPKNRIAFIKEDAQVPVLLSQQQLIGRLSECKDSLLLVDKCRQEIDKEDEANFSGGATIDNLAYVIYTSGSTGRPKGVSMPHDSLNNLLDWQCKNFKILHAAKTLQFTTLSFDVSFQEIFSTLSTGGTLVMISEDLRKDPSNLLHMLREASIERLFVPSIVLQLLAEVAIDQGLIPHSLQEIITAGEQLQITPQIATLLSELRNCTIYNQYGPTESHVVTAFTLKGSPKDWPLLPPIGRPISNSQIYLLDAHLQLVPTGVPGELYIGGAGLARCYLNRPELSAEKFIPNPFCRQPGGILYKTGDLARYLPDGNIEFLGRADQQVKIRGFRIELGEIEVVLSQHPEVQQTVILAREDTPGDKLLVAYVIPEHQQTLTGGKLRSYLKQELPEYMVPAIFVFMDALPLTPNGKVDRRALPAAGGQRHLEKAYTPPKIHLEHAIATRWQEVLHIEKIGVHDNFFELGGHSLQAMKLVSKLSAMMNIDISVRLLFLHPTIADLAEAIKDLSPISERSSKESPNTVVGAVSNAPSDRICGQQLSSFLKIESRSLLSLFATGKIAPVDAAAVGYLPSELCFQIGLTRDEVVNDWCDYLPTLSAVIETSLGRIAVIRLPRLSYELYDDKHELVREILEALNLAGRLGARTISLTGLIPSATDYAHAIAAAMPGQGNLPMISTGHATTSATVVLSIRRILQEAGRDLAQERIGFLGLGSIGRASLRLMLECLPRPQKIILCDIYSKRDTLERIRKEIVDDLKYFGSVKILTSHGEVSSEFYDATLIVGATNVPGILDITKVNPGTIMVDDSAPHCFSPEDAVQRFEKHKDILFTEGGVLQSPNPMTQLRYLPRSLEKKMSREMVETYSKYNPFQIGGCVLSGLLSSCFETIVPTVGLVDDSSCLQNYNLLVELGFQAASLQCGTYVLEKKLLLRFRDRFGGN